MSKKMAVSLKIGSVGILTALVLSLFVYDVIQYEPAAQPDDDESELMDGLDSWTDMAAVMIEDLRQWAGRAMIKTLIILPVVTLGTFWYILYSVWQLVVLSRSPIGHQPR